MACGGSFSGSCRDELDAYRLSRPSGSWPNVWMGSLFDTSWSMVCLFTTSMWQHLFYIHPSVSVTVVIECCVGSVLVTSLGDLSVLDFVPPCSFLFSPSHSHSSLLRCLCCYNKAPRPVRVLDGICMIFKKPSSHSNSVRLVSSMPWLHGNNGFGRTAINERQPLHFNTARPLIADKERQRSNKRRNSVQSPGCNTGY